MKGMMKGVDNFLTAGRRKLVYCGDSGLLLYFFSQTKGGSMRTKNRWDHLQVGPITLHRLVFTARPLFRSLVRIFWPTEFVPKFILHVFFSRYLLLFEREIKYKKPD
jgi:hypothetical protein